MTPSLAALLPSLLAALLPSLLAALQATDCSHLPVPTGPLAQMNTNRAVAGESKDGERTIRLVARSASWYPDGPAGCGMDVPVFMEEGGAPSIPGPLIRVRAGTRVRVSVRNTLEHPILVRGLQDRPVDRLEPTRIEPGGRHEFRFLATSPGSYFYSARAVGSRPLGSGDDGQLAGALIVDPPEGAPPDRIFVLTRWSPPGHLPIAHLPEADPGSRRFELNVINGMSWPYTERLTFTTGDTVRMRVINAGGDAHVMHLHGFHYRVTSRGTNARDVTFPTGEGPLLVSEILTPAQTMSIEWVPTRPGNWLFHCHLQRHMSSDQRLHRLPGATHDARVPHDADPPHNMAGLIVGVTVRAGAGYVAGDEEPRHRMRLFANVHEGFFGEHPAYGFVLQGDDREPAPDSVEIPGSPLLLRRGEPTEIVVHNRIGKPLSVHWHGLELESYFDGVAGWSGRPGRVAPPIAPGDSLAVRITPPRAGTFIYHVHGGHSLDLASGLYGAFLVLEADHPRSLPERDRLFVVSRLPANDTAAVINGSRTPDPVVVRVGETYRFRIIGIMPQEGDLVALRDPAGIARWHLIARDGAELTGDRVSSGTVQSLSAGMTLDFSFRASSPGVVALEVDTVDLFGRPLRRPIRIPVHVEGATPRPSPAASPPSGAGSGPGSSSAGGSPPG